MVVQSLDAQRLEGHACNHLVCDASRSPNQIFDPCKICKRTSVPWQDDQDLHYSSIHEILCLGIEQSTERVMLMKMDSPNATLKSVVLRQSS